MKVNKNLVLIRDALYKSIDDLRKDPNNKISDDEIVDGTLVFFIHSMAILGVDIDYLLKTLNENLKKEVIRLREMIEEYYKKHEKFSDS
jgi:hypothetical protein